MSEQKNSLGMDQKTASWFAYILSIISAIILLVTEKEDKTVRTHAWQSLILGCFFIAVYIVLYILFAITWLWALFGTLIWLSWLAYVVLTVICIVKAVQGDIFKLPVIYDKAKNMK
jgi:uncharacterized membrane protein